MPYFEVCKALAQYRLGRYEEALSWAERTANSNFAYAKAHAYAVMAMANWQLKRADKAHEMLAKGDELATKERPGQDFEKIGDDWLGWLFSRILLDEAGALVNPSSAAQKESSNN
jgi:hypothetical protein